MDALTSRALSRLAPLPGFEPTPCGGGGGGAMMHTNPFSFGLNIALPPPTSFRPFSDGGPVNALRGNPFSFSFGFGPFSGGAAVHVPEQYTNPFSFGFDFNIAHPPHTGYDPFSGGATVRAHEHSNPFAVDRLDDLPPPSRFGPFSGGADTYTGQTYLDNNVHAVGALPALPAADSPRTPVYGNPFNDDGGAAFSMDVPAPRECDLYRGHVKPAVDEPVSPRLNPAPAAPVCDESTCKNSTTLYDDDIEATLRSQEEDVKARPSPDYLETTQGGRMTPKMRTTLVCWMTRMTRRYGLAPGTLHRAVSYADRFLSARPLGGDVTTHRLNLLGAAAVYAAAKYEDQGTTRRLDAREIARYGGFAASQEVVDMELALLAALGYWLGGPTAYVFVDHFTRGYGGGQEEEMGDLELELKSRAHDLADVSLLHYGCLELKPSAVAAAAMFLATLTLEPSYGQMMKSRDRNKEVEELTGYSPKDVERGVEAIRSLVPKDDVNGFDSDIFSHAVLRGS
ncbi:putative cyclin-F2-1 [Dichanthelium oligosanthes]|uniref:Putative cyclin-F2-1 n=1 Tax=Dichanthelium oligosanthes TaxID=888268 RepID=A0A1E5WBA6_9POAL|nr:putative cyclin-F2-1 [Dichanthelium oligosanthes]